MKKVQGDLIALFKSGEFDVIIHAQNCHCNMDDGIALTISQEFPAALHADRVTVAGDRKKMGTYSQVNVTHGVIINAYTQFNYQGVGPNGGPLTEYDAVRSVFAKLKGEFGGHRLRFGVPALGAARAGGDWAIISKIIDEEMVGEDVTFVEYDGEDSPSGDYRANMQ